VTEALEKLRAQVLSGPRAAGDPVRDSLLAAEFDMSRAPAREAVRMLERPGLRVRTPNRSCAAVSFDDRDREELRTGQSLTAEIAYQNPETADRLRPVPADVRDAVARGDQPAAFRRAGSGLPAMATVLHRCGGRS
jgi:DNA-binding GntR family transcriptional regulator